MEDVGLRFVGRGGVEKENISPVMGGFLFRPLFFFHRLVFGLAPFGFSFPVEKGHCLFVYLQRYTFHTRSLAIIAYLQRYTAGEDTSLEKVYHWGTLSKKIHRLRKYAVGKDASSRRICRWRKTNCQEKHTAGEGKIRCQRRICR